MWKVKFRIYNRCIKRPLDILVSLFSLIIIMPVMLIVYILVKFKLGSPVIFKQKRPGLNGKIFTLYKFRSMTDEKDADGQLMSDAVRLTHFGMMLRSTSLDELPEFYNILKGDMSLVGPRPLLVEYLPLYNEYQKKRHVVKPGLTGLAQINGRNLISWEEKFALDVEYTENVKFTKDIKIIFDTFRKTVIREGVNTNTNVTMEVFKGSNSEVNE